MFNKCLTDTYQYLYMINLYLTDPCTNDKLILTDFSIPISIYQYLTVTYHNAYVIKPVSN